MESLQPRHRPYETVNALTPRACSPLEEYYDKRLSDLPSVPGDVCIPVVSRAAVQDPPAQTSTTAIEPKKPTPVPCCTDLDAPALTSKTSVLLRPTLFSIQRIHVVPDLNIGAELEEVWVSQIQERLRIAISHKISTGTCVQEFLMAGKSPTHLKPTIIVSCGDKSVKKRAERAIRSSDWLREILKAYKIDLVALVQTTYLCSMITNCQALDSGQSMRLWLENSNSDFTNGQRLGIGIDPQALCVVGGIVLLDGKPFALTAGHAFKSTGDQEVVTNGSNPYSEEHTSDSEDNEDDESPDEPFFLGHDEDSLEYETTSSETSEGTDTTNRDNNFHTGPMSEAQQQVVASVHWNADPVNTNVVVSPDPHSDWALIAIETLTSSTPNVMPNQSGTGSRHIHSFAAGNVAGDVQIVLAGRTQSGFLHSTPSTLQFGNRIYTARLVTTLRILPLGCSGAWVIANNQLLGHIIAVRQEVPWAYMMPIQVILSSIRSSLNIQRIELSVPAVVVATNEPDNQVSYLPTTNASMMPENNFALHDHEIIPSGIDRQARDVSHQSEADTKLRFSTFRPVSQWHHKTHQVSQNIAGSPIEMEKRIRCRNLQPFQRPKGISDRVESRLLQLANEARQRSATARRPWIDDDVSKYRQKEDISPPQIPRAAGIKVRASTDSGSRTLIGSGLRSLDQSASRTVLHGTTAGPSRLVAVNFPPDPIGTVRRQDTQALGGRETRPGSTKLGGWKLWSLYEEVLLVHEFQRRKHGRGYFSWHDRPRYHNVRAWVGQRLYTKLLFEGLTRMNLMWQVWEYRRILRLMHQLIVVPGVMLFFIAATLVFSFAFCVWHITRYLTWPFHGPCRLWVIQRHREALLDRETIFRDRQRTWDILNRRLQIPVPDLETGHGKQMHVQMSEKVAEDYEVKARPLLDRRNVFQDTSASQFRSVLTSHPEHPDDWSDAEG